jgi:hypothetical protein
MEDMVPVSAVRNCVGADMTPGAPLPQRRAPSWFILSQHLPDSSILSQSRCFHGVSS